MRRRLIENDDDDNDSNGEGEEGRVNGSRTTATAVAAAAAAAAAKARREGEGVIATVWVVSKLYFTREGVRRQAWFWLSTVVLTCFFSTAASLTFSYSQRRFMTALNEKDVKGFYQSIKEFMLIVTVGTPIFAAQDYVEVALTIAWRQWLTEEALRHYYANNNYLHLQLGHTSGGYTIDNPDQRIAADIESFVINVTDLISLVIGKLLNSVAFMGVLISISPFLAAFLLAYGLLGTLIVVGFFGPVLMKLTASILKLQADFRHGLLRVRENAESIAFFGGSSHTLQFSIAQFRKVIDIKWIYTKWTYGLGVFRNAFDFATMCLPSLMIAPRYFSGEVDLGAITQTGMAFRVVFGALTLVVGRITSLSALGAEAKRVKELLEVLGALRHNSHTGKLPDAERINYIRNHSTLKIESLSISIPFTTAEQLKPMSSESMVLVQDLSISLAQGSSLIITGPSGSGKSSLLRAIAGLWIRGSGTIWVPPRLFFLPQKPFVPEGTFREICFFPDKPSVDKNNESDCDDRLKEVLEDVGAAQVMDRYGGPDAYSEDWGSRLSLGEQQRIAAARVLLQSPPPDIVFLDEATSALDYHSEEKLYTTFRQRFPQLISIAHRPSLLDYHEFNLQLEAGGSWSLEAS